MKLKARDIVPGWPRGRSTHAFVPNLGHLEWILFLNQGLRHKTEYLADYQRNAEYHEAQQRMVDRYFQERYRPSDTPPLYMFGQKVWPFLIAT